MTHLAGVASASDHPILHAAIAIAPQIIASADEIERGRRLPKPIVDALKNSGVFGMPMPRSWDGPELDPLTEFRVLETLAMADGSVKFVKQSIGPRPYNALGSRAGGEVLSSDSY